MQEVKMQEVTMKNNNNKSTGEITMKQNNNQKRQGGFSLVEIGIVLIIILGIGAGVYVAYDVTNNSVKEKQVTEEIQALSLAVQRCIARDDSSFKNCKQGTIVALSGVNKGTNNTKTPCNTLYGAFVVVGGTNNDTITISYPLSGCTDAVGLGNSLEAKIKKLPNMGTSKYSTANSGTFTIIGTTP